MSIETEETFLTREFVFKAHDIIQTYIHKTPVITCQTLNKIASAPRNFEGPNDTRHQENDVAANPNIRFYFKCENFQKIGAFKARGAYHAISRLPEGIRKKGIVTHSSGNHAQATALACRTFNVEAHIVMPNISTKSKIDSTKSLGAHVYFSGSTSTERMEKVEQVMSTLPKGAVILPPYDDKNVILGQGTLALELERTMS